MAEKKNPNIHEEHPERPLECTECKRPIAFHYTEIVGEMKACTGMCSDCPILRLKLQGTPHIEQGANKKEVGTLACGNCGTTLESIRVGTPLGCDVCYEVFGDLLLAEMIAAEKVPLRISKAKKSIPVHIGRSPGQNIEISPSLRLLALNEALNETLKSEDYEQAAWLRDQIKALTDKKEETSS